MQIPQSDAERAVSARSFSHLDSPASHYQHPGTLQQYRTVGADRSAQLAKALGWFGIGLGLAQLFAPQAMARAAGMPGRSGLMRAVGVREIASGVGIVSQREPSSWLWSRVAGDAMDLVLLGAAARKPFAPRWRIAAATAAVAGVTVLDVMASVQNSRKAMPTASWAERGEVHVEKAITVNRSAEECYRFWRAFENFPQFMTHLESVEKIDERLWHWKAKAPMGASVEWDAELTVEQPGQLLAWRSVEGSDIVHAGTVSFEEAAGGRGTLVRVDLQYRPPGGKAGALLAKLFREEPTQQIDEDLRNFKRLIETGEIPTTVGQPSGKRGVVTRLLFRRGQTG